MGDFYTELAESADTDIGLLPVDLYDGAMPAWAAWVRGRLLARLPAESAWLAAHQRAMRARLGRAGDIFFVYTSLLGTHSFFLIFLPLTFWLGAPRNGRGLVAVTALGCWLTSYVKDRLCLPRPYAPPMRRLALGLHHLEYGFPSTHTANCVAMALFGYLLLSDRVQAALQPNATLPPVPAYIQHIVTVVLAIYAFSVSYGRIYAGMHSLMDVTGGAVIGALVVWLQRVGQPWVEAHLQKPSLVVPVLLNALTLIIISVHPQPVDDCPCFEDAVAFMAVLAGVNTGRWFGVRMGWLVLDDDPLRMHAKMDLFLPRTSVRLTRGSGLLQRAVESVLDLPRTYVNPFLGVSSGPEQPWAGRASFLVPLVIFLLGTTHLIVLRLVVKSLGRIVLPRLFHRVHQATHDLIVLRRRFYTPACEYGGVVPPIPLTPTPSIMDDFEWAAPASSASTPPKKQRAAATPPEAQQAKAPPTAPNLFLCYPSEKDAGLRQRLSAPPTPVPTPVPAPVGNESESEHESVEAEAEPDLPTRPKIRHYDVDVLVKYLTYSAIGFHAAMVLPVLFQRFGWLPLA